MMAADAVRCMRRGNGGGGGGDLYEFVRITVTSVYDGGSQYSPQVSEFEIYGDGPENLFSGCVIVSATPHSGSSLPDLAFDGGTATRWVNSLLPGIITVQLSSPSALSDFAVRAGGVNTNVTNDAPKDFTVEGSLDGVDWVTLGVFYDPVQWGLLERRVYPLNQQ